MGQRAALGQFLAFTRAQETSADLAGVKYLSAAGISGKGSLEFFKKLQNQEYRLAIYATDSYERTHPLSGERISILENLYKKDPAWDRPSDPQLEARFQRVKAKLFGFVNSRQAIIKYPESDQTVPAHYARAYAYHLGAYPEKALSEAEALLKTNPHDPYFLELKGQILPRIRPSRRGHCAAARSDRTVRTGAAHRIHAGPRSDLDRGQEELRRGQDHPEDRRVGRQ